ncbi:MAG TPA: AMP-binding protein, partial [Acidimicrobiales bacterium]|nr:AMP-binding protein [Acidimicrobiales bacterium]
MPPSRLAPTLPGALRAAAEHDPGRPALTDGQRSLTYGDLAGLLEEDPEGHPGEVRALDAGDPFELVVDLVRLTAGGAAVAPIDPELPTAAREAMCARLHPVDPVRPGGAGPDPDDVALVIATSGTTARPTLVEQTHRNLRVSAEGARDRLRVTPEDGVLALTPFSHVLALRATLDGLWIGSTVVLLRGAATGGRLEAMVEGIEHPATTYVSGSPAALEALAAVYERRSPPSGLRLVRSGGAPLSALSQERIQAALGVPVLVGYGMTQAAKIATPAFPPDPADAGTVGRPLVELQIVDD